MVKKEESKKKVKKIFRVMRISMVIVFTCMVSIFAEKTYSQGTAYSLTLKNATIRQVISEIKRQSGYAFLMKGKVDAELDRVVDFSVKEKEFSEILESLFAGTNLSYTISGRQVFVSVKESETGKVSQEKTPVVEQAVMQDIVITGKVTEADGMPLPGVTVVVKGTTLGTATDADGAYSLQVPNENVTLVFSYIGFATREVAVGKQRRIDIALMEDTHQIEEVVVIAYGIQKKVSVTGAIASVQTKELKQSSAANLSSALAGRLPGLTALQTSGQPGNDAVNLYLRGVGTVNDASPLILIDGVPRTNISVLDPNEIASVSILKDASATAVFGVRGANGAILITTRRGTPGKAELSISIDRSIQQFTTHAMRLHSWEHAELYNQAFRNDNPSAPDEDLPFTPYMIDMYKSGANPAFYPDRDVFHEYFRDWAPQTRVNANLNGGTEKISYFLNVGYIGQGGHFKTEPESQLGYDPSYRMDRYTFRSNVDYSIARNLKISLNIGSYLEKMNTPSAYRLFDGDINYMVANMMMNTWATPPTDPGPLTVEGYGVPVGEVLRQRGMDRATYGEINRCGYRQETSSMLNSSLALDWGLDFITRGLSAKATMAFDFKGRTVLDSWRQYGRYAWEVARTPDKECLYVAMTYQGLPNLTLVKLMNSYYYMNFQMSLNYARSFGSHDVGAMALFQRDNYERADYIADLPFNVIGYVGRVTYGFDERYLAEFNVGYNGTEQFAPANRFGLFPAVSAGWVVSNESFLKDNPLLTHLKIRASYGKVGNDRLGGLRFLYLGNIQRTGGKIASLGRGSGIVQGLMANEHIQWEEAVKQNYGLDIEILKSLSFNVDLFWEKRDKILIGRSTIPVLQGIPLRNLPRVNMGKMDNRGYELELTYRKTVNSDFSFTVKGNYTYNENKIVEADEPMLSKEYAYRYRQTGYSRGQPFGYQVDYSNGNGYINTQEELDQALLIYDVGGTPRLGDLKYIDANNDGVIDSKDHVPMGYSEIPRISYGFSGMVNYKNLDFSFLFAGVAKTSRMYTGIGVTEFGAAGFFNEWHLHAWTQERYGSGYDIQYPALGLTAGSSQPISGNSFYLFNRSFLRLKNVETGYNLPQKWISPIHISKVRVYVNGNNLLTWKKYPVNVIDPESTSLNVYPITRMINAGINVIF